MTFLERISQALHRVHLALQAKLIELRISLVRARIVGNGRQAA